jgi:hypothetical protein
MAGILVQSYEQVAPVAAERAVGSVDLVDRVGTPVQS